MTRQMSDARRGHVEKTGPRIANTYRQIRKSGLSLRRAMEDDHADPRIGEDDKRQHDQTRRHFGNLPQSAGDDDDVHESCVKAGK